MASLIKKAIRANNLSKEVLRLKSLDRIEAKQYGQLEALDHSILRDTKELIELYNSIIEQCTKELLNLN